MAAYHHLVDESAAGEHGGRVEAALDAQPISNPVRTDWQFGLLDLAYSPDYGKQMGSLFKSYVRYRIRSDDDQVTLDYEQEKQCKAPECDFSTLSILDMLGHIRWCHLEEN